MPHRKQPTHLTSPESKVICVGITDSRSVRSFIEMRISRWLESLGITTPVRFTAQLRKEGRGHLVYCELEIDSGTEVWNGTWLDEGLHQALIGCLNHLEPRPVHAVQYA